MQAKLITTFDSLNESSYLAKAGAIVTALTANVCYPEPRVVQVPTLTQLTDAYTAYLDRYHAALSHDSLKIARRNTARQGLTELFKRLVPYLELIAQGDVQVLATTGYDLRKDIVHGGGDVLPAPTDFRVEHGAKSGSLYVHVARLSGAGSYEVQTAQGDPAIEDNWHHVLSSLTSDHILLEDLILG
ncbi:MAG: fibronectin type III domain-containing protein [Methylococcales bacterium]|nr:MAG: fibronectin type III domain-containing protein [Methylococcales bacterium]